MLAQVKVCTINAIGIHALSQVTYLVLFGIIYIIPLYVDTLLIKMWSGFMFIIINRAYCCRSYDTTPHFGFKD